MNEQKLKELWWKARIGYNEQNCDPEVLAKFAELIVRECVDICNDTNDASYLNGVIASRKIKQHFGVKE